MEGNINYQLPITHFASKRAKHQLKKGFTLMELVILLGVVGIMMSGILTLYFNVITVNKSSEYYSSAYKLIDSEIEELRGTSFENITNVNTDISELPSGHLDISVSNEIDGAPQDDIKKVDVVISWYFRKQSQVREITYIAKGGIKR